MKSNNNYSQGYANYLKNIKREKVKVLLIQIALLIGILVLWEVLANYGIIQTFLFSKPSDIYKLFIKYISNGELARHVGISVYETVLGLVIGTVLGILVAIAPWWSEKSSKIKPSLRGELEITSLNEMYIKENKLSVKVMGRGFAWIDAGTMDALVEASEFVQMIEKRQGIKISAPEEIACNNGWINKDELMQAANKYGKSPYGKHLKNVAENKLQY